jgi:ElaB/YqjD/DUF883 family membrane-anchored ribosome-binding protein
MAKSSDELERELDAQRQQLYSRVQRLRERVAGDVRGMRDETQAQLDGYKHQAEGYVHKAEATASEHPWLTMSGGFGTGIALGVTGPSFGGHRNGSSSHGGSPGGSGESESLLSRGVGAFVSMASGPVVDEVRGQLQSSLSEIKDAVQDSVSEFVHGITGNGSNAATHRQKVRDHAA